MEECRSSLTWNVTCVKEILCFFFFKRRNIVHVSEKCWFDIIFKSNYNDQNIRKNNIELLRVIQCNVIISKGHMSINEKTYLLWAMNNVISLTYTPCPSAVGMEIDQVGLQGSTA